jgi:flavin-dependent dehydrogenase
MMSALGQKQTSRHVRVMSVIPLKADICQRIEHVCFVPKADLIRTVSQTASNFRRTALFDWLADPVETAGLEHVAAFTHADHRRHAALLE